MSLSRKSLKAMGLTDEQIESVVEMHSETVTGLKEKLEVAEKSNQSTEKIKSDYEKAKQELEELKKTAAENAKYKESYEALKGEYDGYKADVETKTAKEAADKAFTKWLRDSGYSEKGAAKIVKYGGYKPEFNKDGSIKNAEKFAESIEAEWSEYKGQTKVESARAETPPTNTGGKAKPTKDEIMKIQNTADRQRAIAENPELFGLK